MVADAAAAKAAAKATVADVSAKAAAVVMQPQRRRQGRGTSFPFLNLSGAWTRSTKIASLIVSTRPSANATRLNGARSVPKGGTNAWRPIASSSTPMWATTEVAQRQRRIARTSRAVAAGRSRRRSTLHRRQRAALDRLASCGRRQAPFAFRTGSEFMKAA